MEIQDLPDKDLEHQKDHFESIAEKYHSARQNPTHQCLKNIIWEEALQGILPRDFNSDIKVLEAMCGAADSIVILDKIAQLKSYNFHGFDYSEKMVEFARKLHPHAEIWQQDITVFQKIEEYDLIFAIGGLHHVYGQVQKSLTNLSRALKPGGILISFEPTHNNFLLRKVREYIYKKNELFDQDTERAFTTVELNQLFEEAGLRPIRQIYPGLLAYILWYNPDAFPLLQLGNPALVERYTQLEKKIWATGVANYFSFATLSVLTKS